MFLRQPMIGRSATNGGVSNQARARQRKHCRGSGVSTATGLHIVSPFELHRNIRRSTSAIIRSGLPQNLRIANEPALADAVIAPWPLCGAPTPRLADAAPGQRDEGVLQSAAAALVPQRRGGPVTAIRPWSMTAIRSATRSASSL